jgi:galactokinase
MQQLVADTFRQTFGESPSLLVRAPGRINLIGEHTDYNEGLVLPAAINRAIYFALSPRADDALHFHALNLQQTYVGDCHQLHKSPLGWPNYLLGCWSELQRDGHVLGGMNVIFGGDIPNGAGLSSSAAIESGLLFALNRLFDLRLETVDLACLAQRAENRFVGMNCGIMDMFASLMGRRDHALRLDCRSLKTTWFPLHLSDYTIVLCDSGVKHQLVDSAYNTRRAQCEAGVAIMKQHLPNVHSLRDITLEQLEAASSDFDAVVYRRCRFVLQENTRVEAACVALSAQDWPSFGQLLLAGHRGLRDDYEVSCPEIDFLVDAAAQHPAVLGARMTGGGFGGCTINLVHTSEVVEFQHYMLKKYAQYTSSQLRTWAVAATDGVGEG